MSAVSVFYFQMMTAEGAEREEEVMEAPLPAASDRFVIKRPLCHVRLP